MDVIAPDRQAADMRQDIPLADELRRPTAQIIRR